MIILQLEGAGFKTFATNNGDMKTGVVIEEMCGYCAFIFSFCDCTWFSTLWDIFYTLYMSHALG